MVLSLPFSMKLIKRNGKNLVQDDYDDLSTTSSTVTTAFDDDSSSFAATGHSSSTTWDSASKSNGVRFAVHLNVEYTNEAMSKCELKDLWYQGTDYQSFRTLAYDTAQQIIATEKRNRAPHSYQRVMERTYAACCSYGNEKSHDDSVDVVNSSLNSYDDTESMIQGQPTDEKRVANTIRCSVLSAEEFVHLQRWLEVGSSRIGLEKHTLRCISMTKSTRRDMIAETILSIQQQQEKDKLNGKLQSIDAINVDAEFIRRTSEHLSRPSCLFSLVLAQGLAAAIAKENSFISI